VEVALFRIKDFSDAKHRFKVDVNMQQLNLTGIVVLCPAAGTNLVVAEGGPKGIKKLVHLMTKR
jgi:U4/U6 small nuclear ribonucleoprotein PRP3